MNPMKIHKPKQGLAGAITIPGDKSISHRAVMLGALAHGKTKITNFLTGEDCLCTAKAFQEMGIGIEGMGTDKVTVYGNGLHGLQEPKRILDMGNSGTSMRLMSGILSAQPFFSILTGDSSLCSRPMDRVVKPLKMMGAVIHGRENAKFPPLAIIGQPLRSIHYNSPVASAQVKSCVLLAGLFTKGTTSVAEPALSRNHTENMLRYMGAELVTEGTTVKMKGLQELNGVNIHVPGDISSAAFFLAAGLLVPDSKITLKNVGINETRTGILDALNMMGAEIKYKNIKNTHFEPVADLVVQTCKLLPVELSGDIIPRIIDEIPILVVLATQANGTTVIRNARELRVKETDRIKTIYAEFTKMGANIEELEDGLIIHGPTPLKGAEVISHGDHRIAMSLAIAGLIAQGKTTIEDTACIKTSFPNFQHLLHELGA